MTYRHVLHEFMTDQPDDPAEDRRHLFRDIAISATVGLVAAFFFLERPSNALKPMPPARPDILLCVPKT
jgi:hypothetical protein